MAKKKAAQLPPLSETLVAPDPNDEEASILELDELWSFVWKRVNQVWIWIALCRKTRQVVARAVGDRSQKTCQELWNNIPDVYRKGHCFADFWKAYQAVIPEEQLTGSAARKRVKQHTSSDGIVHFDSEMPRFVRETFSFSKIMPMHIICLDLFLHRYNLDRAILLD